ncbi:MAG: MBL fold metallo-hydrolase [Erysipelotrichaceae bacterium]|nr:MBL fold metallo-hydrolase [Erysipelotrichaceae bacterium]
MSDIVIIPIGSGSTGNCFYIEMKDHRFLIDMGIGVRRVRDVLAHHDRLLDDIEAIFVTHGHTDHVKSASAITNNTRCKVYADKSSMYSLRDIKSETECINVNETFEPLEGLKVRTFSVPHDFVRTLGYVFEYEGRKIGYVTDCGKMNDGIISELAGSDVVIIESNHDVEMLKNGPYPRQLQHRILSQYGHLSNDDCADTVLKLYEAGTRNFLLAHISLINNTSEIAFKTTKEKLKDREAYLYVCPDLGDDLLTF